MTTLPLRPGDPAPWFVAPSPTNPRYHFDSVAGRYIALCFFGSAATPAVAEMLARIRGRKDVFDDEHASFFGVSGDPDDERLQRVAEIYPGHRLFWDFGLKVSAAYGACEPKRGEPMSYRPQSFILDPRLRVLAILPIEDPLAHARALLDYVGACRRSETGSRHGRARPSCWCRSSSNRSSVATSSGSMAGRAARTAAS
jgi:peroxiredoxin